MAQMQSGLQFHIDVNGFDVWSGYTEGDTVRVNAIKEHGSQVWRVQVWNAGGTSIAFGTDAKETIDTAIGKLREGNY